MSMVRGIVVIAVACVLGMASSAQAQNQRVTEQCSAMRAMQWLATAAGLDDAGRQMIDDRERVSCGAGLEASANETWPNGVTLRSGDSWYYPNGTTYYSGGTWYYSNGVTFGTSSGTYYYANGTTIVSGETWCMPNGSPSSETGLITFAIGRQARERGDYLLGLRANEGTPFWRMIYLMAMVWEVRP